MDGEKLRELRIRAGMSQAEVADSVGCTQSTLSRWESGERRIFADDVIALARVLRIEVSELLT